MTPQNIKGNNTQNTTMPQGTGEMSNPFVPKQTFSQTEAHTLLTNDIKDNVPKEVREPIMINCVSEMESMSKAQQRVSMRAYSKYYEPLAPISLVKAALWMIIKRRDKKASITKLFDIRMIT